MTAEKCRHCRRLIVQAVGRWTHATGVNWGQPVCHVDGRRFEAHPHGEPCRVGCDGHEPGLRAVPS